MKQRTNIHTYPDYFININRISIFSLSVYLKFHFVKIDTFLKSSSKTNKKPYIIQKRSLGPKAEVVQLDLFIQIRIKRRFLLLNICLKNMVPISLVIDFYFPLFERINKFSLLYHFLLYPLTTLQWYL